MNYEVFEDHEVPGQWRAEAFDEDGGCYVVTFSFPNPADAEAWALDFAERMRQFQPSSICGTLALLDAARSHVEAVLAQSIDTHPGNAKYHEDDSFDTFKALTHALAAYESAHVSEVAP